MDSAGRNQLLFSKATNRRQQVCAARSGFENAQKELVLDTRCC